MSTTAKQPYLSLVLAARNDNYGGDFEQRLQNCLSWFCYYADKFKLQAEFVIVNYNPVADRPSLKQAIAFPKSPYVSYRIITVPNSFHEKISDAAIRKKVPMYEYIAKNIGIRRTKGQFILAANPDILIDPAIIRFLAAKNLDAETFYRVDRCDYSKEVKNINPATDLSRIRKAVFRVFMKGFLYPVKPGGFLMVRIKALSVYNNLRLRYQLWLAKHQDFANRYSLSINPDYIEYMAHCNCSGDFMLMHRNAWQMLRAYPEKTFLAIHTDALMVAMAFFSNLRQQVLSNPVYHQDHERRYEPDKPAPDVEAMYRFFETEGKKMEAMDKPIIYNDEDWGFANETFEEEVIEN